MSSCPTCWCWLLDRSVRAINFLVRKSLCGRHKLKVGFNALNSKVFDQWRRFSSAGVWGKEKRTHLSTMARCSCELVVVFIALLLGVPTRRGLNHSTANKRWFWQWCVSFCRYSRPVEPSNVLWPSQFGCLEREVLRLVSAKVMDFRFEDDQTRECLPVGQTIFNAKFSNHPRSVVANRFPTASSLVVHAHVDLKTKPLNMLTFLSARVFVQPPFPVVFQQKYRLVVRAKRTICVFCADKKTCR